MMEMLKRLESDDLEQRESLESCLEEVPDGDWDDEEEDGDEEAMDSDDDTELADRLRGKFSFRPGPLSC